MTIELWHMARYLPERRADYHGTLSITPHEVLPFEGGKHQAIYELDNKRLAVVPICSTSSFDIQLQWTHLTESDAGTILAFYHDTSKCNGSQRTFYWQHPTETSNLYIARFLSPPKGEQVAGYVGYMSISVSLRLEGVYSAITTTTTTTSSTTTTTASTVSTTTSTSTSSSSSSTTTTTD